MCREIFGSNQMRYSHVLVYAYYRSQMPRVKFVKRVDLDVALYPLCRKQFSHLSATLKWLWDGDCYVCHAMKSSKASSPICTNEGSMNCHVFVQLPSHSWKVVTVRRYMLWQRMWTTFITKDGSCEIYWLRPGPLVVTVLKKLFIVTASGQFDGIMCLFSTVKVVPYSDHCSFSELWQFVTSVRPRCVRPIVRHFTGDRNTITLSRANMSIFDELLDPTPSVSVLVTFT